MLATVYLFHPKRGARVQISEKAQMPKILNITPLLFMGLAAIPFTITL